MKCAFPIPLAFDRTVPCGQCMNCRINRQRKWVGRILLEATQHSHVWFVTLTYSDENLRYTPGFLPTLVPRDLTLFWKRLRFALGYEVRYFAAGEYGTRTERPHYHAILFGLRPEDVDQVERQWRLGFVQVAEFSVSRARYVAQYTLKKMTAPSDERLQGRHPEFVRVSGKPGLGVRALEGLAKVHATRGGAAAVAELGDVGRTFRQDGAVWPLDRLLLGKLRGLVGVPEAAQDRVLAPPVEEADVEAQAQAVRVHDQRRRRYRAAKARQTF